MRRRTNGWRKRESGKWCYFNVKDGNLVSLCGIEALTTNKAHLKTLIPRKVRCEVCENVRCVASDKEAAS